MNEITIYKAAAELCRLGFISYEEEQTMKLKVERGSNWRGSFHKELEKIWKIEPAWLHLFSEKFTSLKNEFIPDREIILDNPEDHSDLKSFSDTNIDDIKSDSQRNSYQKFLAILVKTDLIESKGIEYLNRMKIDPKSIDFKVKVITLLKEFYDQNGN